MTAWIAVLRPRQWLKNVFVLAPLFFAHRFLDGASWQAALQAAACFMAISSTVYIANDIRDLKEDRLHPIKKLRPMASGRLTVAQGLGIAFFTALAGVLLLLRLPPDCATVILVYVWLNLCYTLYLKRIAVLDVFCVAGCYVLRVLMGCYALAVTVSPWIILTTFLLALFLGFGRRYHEMAFAEYVSVKRNLQHYSRELLDKLVVISGGATLLAYAIYTVEAARLTERVALVYTVGFVAFGLFRYLQSIYVYGQGGEPEATLLKDKVQLANIALWLAVTLWIAF